MTLNIGFIDGGWIFDWHYRAFSAEPRCRIAGLTRTLRPGADRAGQLARLHATAAKYQVRPFDGIDEMLASDEIDAVVIASINPFHCEQALRALESGKHIMIEKPVAHTGQEIDAIAEAAARKGLVAMPAHNFACRGGILEAKRRIDAGKLGRIQYGSFTQSFFCGMITPGSWRSFHAEAWGGALMDSGTHLVYQTVQLLGRPSAVQAFLSRNVLEMEDEDIAAVQLHYPSGAIVHLMQNWGSGHGQDIEGIRLVGSEGRIAVSDALYVNGEKIAGDVDYAGSFRNQARCFASAVLDGQPPPSTLDDARLTLQIVDAAMRSAREGVTVRL